MQKEFGSFSNFIWQFTSYKVINTNRLSDQTITTSPQSDAMSADLKARGFKFVGTTICYAFMQAAGLVNDHAVNCFRHQEV